MQETHSNSGNELKWRSEWGGDIYFCHGLASSRGVMILFKNNVDYTLHSVFTDKEGRWIVIDIMINNLHIILLNIHAPNEDSPLFFGETNTYLNSLQSNQIIITGDFNTVLDTNKDRSGLHKINNHPHALREIQEMAASLDLVDIWRLLNKDTMRYTWRRGKQASRIDYFLISFSLVPKVLNCCIGDCLRSDHSLVTLLIDNRQCSRGRGYWKFNVSFLNDDSFIDITRRFIK